MAKKPNPQSGQPTAGSGEPEPKGYERVIANWTRVLGVSTIALFIATAISAYFLFETDQTIKKQLGTAQVQLRAYAGIQQIFYIPRNVREADKPAVFLGSEIGVSWRNFGTTPAREFQAWLSAKWYADGTEPDFARPFEKLSDTSAITLGGGVELPTANVFVPAEDIRKANARNGRIFLWGSGTYRDVFPDTPIRRFHFCMIGVIPLTEIEGGAAGFRAYKTECNNSS